MFGLTNIFSNGVSKLSSLKSKSISNNTTQDESATNGSIQVLSSPLTIKSDSHNIITIDTLNAFKDKTVQLDNINKRSIMGICDGEFPVTNPIKDRIYYHSNTDKYYVTKISFIGTIEEPDDNFEEVTVNSIFKIINSTNVRLDGAIAGDGAFDSQSNTLVVNTNYTPLINYSRDTSGKPISTSDTVFSAIQKLDGLISTHKHTSNSIITNDDNMFVNSFEKTYWNNKVDRSGIYDNLVAGAAKQLYYDARINISGAASGGASFNGKDTADINLYIHPNGHSHPWSVLTEVPSSFPPSAHIHKIDDIGILSGYTKISGYDGVSEFDTIKSAIGKLEGILSDKADKLHSHEHVYAPISHGNHPEMATLIPMAPGIGATGTSNNAAREDHVHPQQLNIDGVSGSSHVLHTPRSINGTEFNGSKDIITNIWGSPRTITIGNASKVINGSQDVQFTHDELGLTRTSIIQSNINSAGWYRIAQCDPTSISLNEFIIKASSGRSYVSQTSLIAGICKNNSAVTLNQLGHTTTNNGGVLVSARIAYATNTDKMAYLEVYNYGVSSTSGISLNIQMIGSHDGFELIDPISVPDALEAGYMSTSISFVVGGFMSNGGFYGNLIGNASTATKLQNPRTITITGDVTGSVSFDGSANVSITTTVGNDSHSHSWGNITGKPSTFTPSGHNQASNTITAMTGYAKASAVAAIAATDSLNVAIGKLEKALDGKQASGSYAAASHNHDTVYAKVSHGNHVPATQTASNKVFLRNDNTWQTITPANIGAAAASHTHAYLPTSGGTISGALTVTGQILSNADVVAYSDARFKTNLQVIDNPINKILSINGYKYDMLGVDNCRQVGVIAQEIEQILPEAVYKDQNGHLGVRYTNLIPLLIEGFKQQQKEIQLLKRQLGMEV